MWAFSFLAFLANPLLGTVLLLSAAVTTGLKAAKVDAEWARRGEMPPTARLVEKWLDGRKAAGTAPAAAKVKPYGSWAYAWQRWYAMWEDLGDKHREDRAAHKQAVADAKRDGLPAPVKPKPTTGWKWSLLVDPVGERNTTTPPAVLDTAPAPASPTGPVIACDVCGSALIDRNGGWQHPADSDCPKATTVVPPAPGSDAIWRCDGCGDWPLGAVPPSRLCNSCLKPGQTPTPAPPTSQPHAGDGITACVHCGGPLFDHASDRETNRLGRYCIDCDRTGTYTDGLGGEQECPTCRRRCYTILVRPATAANPDRAEMPVLVHYLNDSAACPTREQVDEAAAQQTAQTSPLVRANTIAPEEGEIMTAPTTQQTGEVVGLQSAINYATAVASAHGQHSTGGGEQYRASLAQAEVGPETIQSAASAQELSEMAAAAWAAHAEKLREQMAAKEHTTAETGSKTFLLND